MKKLTFYFLLFPFLFGCQHPSSTTGTKKQIISESLPKLLDRPEKLWYGKEWEDMQNYYAGALQQIAKNDSPEAYLRLCEVFINEARVTGEHGHYYPAALQVLDILEKQKDLSSDLRFQLLSYKASVLLSQHAFKKALVAGQEALKLNSYNAQIYGVLVDANVELGNYAEAVEMADKMVAIRPDLRSYSRVSYLREIHGDFEGAIEAMEMAVSAGYPGMEQSEWTRLTLGHLYETYGKPELAALQYQTALNNRENYPFAIAALAGMEMTNKNYKNAEKLLKEASAIIPEVSFYVQLAMLYKETGEREKAQQLESQIFEMLADDVKSGHNMNLEYANIYLNLQNEPKEALNYAMKEYELRPENIDVNKILSMIYFEMEDFDNAEKHLQVANKTHSANPELLCLSGLIDIAKGQKAAGIAILKKSFAINPFQSHNLSALGRNYM